MDAREQPLVTIIAISYNHAAYIHEALQSVYAQSYPNIELIIVDDASIDASAEVIQSSIQGRTIRFLKNASNLGNCKSFNKAFALSTGKYIIDFALDDIMYPTRIEKQVALLEQSTSEVGVVFSNVDRIDAEGKLLNAHYPAFHHKSNKKNIPVGDVFDALLSQYYINPVSMMFRREVVERLNGYDESLAYEDFDFWIRSSHFFKYGYIPEILSAKRIVPTSLSAQFYKTNQKAMFESTLKVCKKAWWLCATDIEREALVQRCRYEARKAYTYKYPAIVREYLSILKLYDRFYWLYKPIALFLLRFKN